ncbi:MAG: Fe-S cluster assembly protein SufD [Bacteroidota bacterium]
MSVTAQDKHTNTKDWFSTLFKVYESGLNGHGNHPIAHFRRAGFEQFEGADFPTTRDEDWKYTSVKRIVQQKYQEASAPALSEESIADFTFPELDAVRLVFVNGIWNKELSNVGTLPAELHIQSVDEALESEENSAWVAEQIAQKGGTDKNAFLPMNRAFSDNGIFIKIEKNTTFERPIHLLHLSVPNGEAHMSHPQLFVWAQRSSNLTFIESFQSTSETGNYFNNAAHWIDVADNAQVSYYRLQFESKEAFHINNTIVRQGRDSVFSTYAVDLGGRMVRNNLSTELLASGTETNMYCAYLGDDRQHIDNQTFMDHAMPHCVSNELYKGILTDRARGVFNGKVLVRQDAQKTNAFQQNSSLVLSKTAVMDAKPQLEIYADDVRCSHGATIGQLDEGSIFYLRSRGIPEAKAKNLLQRAFVGEVIEAMKLEAIQERVLAKIEAKLG